MDILEGARTSDFNAQATLMTPLSLGVQIFPWLPPADFVAQPFGTVGASHSQRRDPELDGPQI